jgi:general secretion pathway protein G
MQSLNIELHRRLRRLGVAARARSRGAGGRRQLSRRQLSRRQLGMTLIEIMVVVAIISLIMGGVGIMAFNRFQDAQVGKAETEVITIRGAIETYRLNKRGKCPKSMQDLKAANTIDKIAKDPWGTDYEFKCPGEKDQIDVISAGPDTEMGTADDIASYDDPNAKEGEEEDK